MIKHDAKKLTMHQLERIKQAHDDWRAESHGENQKQYHKAKDRLIALCLEFAPQMADLAEKQLKWADG